MTAAAITIASALAIVFVAALVMDWIESRRDWREWQQDHPTPREPLSNLDRLDGVHDRDELQP